MYSTSLSPLCFSPSLNLTKFDILLLMIPFIFFFAFSNSFFSQPNPAPLDNSFFFLYSFLLQFFFNDHAAFFLLLLPLPLLTSYFSVFLTSLTLSYTLLSLSSLPHSSLPSHCRNIPTVFVPLHLHLYCVTFNRMLHCWPVLLPTNPSTIICTVAVFASQIVSAH